MQYLHKYDSFKNSQKSEEVNEELLGSLFKAATGAFKNFITGISAPFKNLANDFKKGMKLEEAKKKMTTAIETMLKSATDNINKAKDENEINQMKDAFMKALDEKMAEFDKEIKTIKESNLINEGAVQDTMIGGRVLFGMLKDELAKIKTTFDQKFAAAKDLAGKKNAAIAGLKTAVDNFKKKIADENLLKQATDKYKTDNKIQSTGGADQSDELLKSYGVDKKEDLVGKEVRYKTKQYDPNKKPEDQPDNIGKLKVMKVTEDGLMFDGEKEDFEKKMDQVLPAEKQEGGNEEEELKTTLGALKGKPEMTKILNVAKIYKDPQANAAKIAEIEKAIGTEAK